MSTGIPVADAKPLQFAGVWEPPDVSDVPWWDDPHPGEVNLTRAVEKLREAEALLRRVDAAFVESCAGWHGASGVSISAVLRDVRAFLDGG